MELTLVPHYGPLKTIQKPQWCPNKQFKNAQCCNKTNNKFNGPESKSLRLTWELMYIWSLVWDQGPRWTLHSAESKVSSCDNTDTQCKSKNRVYSGIVLMVWMVYMSKILHILKLKQVNKLSASISHNNTHHCSQNSTTVALQQPQADQTLLYACSLVRLRH